MTALKTRIYSLAIATSLSLAHSVFALSSFPAPSQASSFDRDLHSITAKPTLLDIESLEKEAIEEDNQSDPLSFENMPIATISPLEKLYSERLKNPISQFGYNLFSANPTEPSSAAVQESYILESGDEINILLRGGRNIQSPVIIGDDGMLVIDTLPPLQAVGKTMSALREELNTLTQSMYNTEIYLSVAKTRKLNISVSGNVTHPGQITLSTFNTVLDALGKSGGVNKNGSLRQIKLIRGTQTLTLDLYGVLIYGSATTDITLRDGDRIIVPPIGPTLAVAGSVKRPGIYEILPSHRALWHREGETSQKLTVGDMLDLSGGTLMPSKTRYLRLTLENKSADAVSDVTYSDERIFGDGDILLINQLGTAGKSDFDYRSGSIELSGASPQAGLYALAETPSLSSLLKDETFLGTDVYPLIGIIQRWKTGQLSKEFIAFSPLQILARKNDIQLQESDIVLLFDKVDILRLKIPEESEAIEEDADTKKIKSEARLPSDIKNFLVSYSVFLRGSIQSAGQYPIAKETTLEDLFSVAGGPSLEANIENIEITQPRADKPFQRSSINLSSTPASLITLHPGDTIRIGQNFRRIKDRHVLLTGEVNNPGAYDLIAGDTLSTLIQRAGGLTEQAYPEGSIFSRKSERSREEERYKTQARHLELSLATALQENKKEKNLSAEEISLARNLISELKGAEAIGRITIEADPLILETHPELDILLESGDKIFIPKRPLTVRVAGEILSPAALQFRTGKTPRDYINEAGGFSYNADQDRSFVVFPDGSAQPLAVSAWNHKAAMIPPGSTIIIPRDPKPLTFMDGARDLSQILANLATTAIFADDLADER